MTETTDMTSPMMEFRETARRFAWLCLVLAVICLITTVANETFGPFGSAERLNWLKPKKRDRNTPSQRRISGKP